MHVVLICFYYGFIKIVYTQERPMHTHGCMNLTIYGRLTLLVSSISAEYKPCNV